MHEIEHNSLPDRINATFDVAYEKRRTFVRLCLAEWTGLEPATPGVTGRYSNQLNYHSPHSRRRSRRFFQSGCSCPPAHPDAWWVLTGSNRRHSPCKGDALPTELSTPEPGQLRGQAELEISPSVYSILQR